MYHLPQGVCDAAGHDDGTSALIRTNYIRVRPVANTWEQP